MQTNPILAEMTRGNWVENRHRGAICISDSSGATVASVGDVAHDIFPRSAIKSIQALALYQSGAMEKFDLSDEAVALACASHMGEAMHVDGVARALKQIDCGFDDLECGAHSPANRGARKALQETGAKPGAQHNNCSGKHTGMLAVAKALNVPTEGYSTRDHAVQKLVRQSVETVIGADLTTQKCGTDGCSIPTWAAPLNAFAQGFARMATGDDLPESLAVASKAIFDAATKNPYLVRGTDTLDSDLMAAFSGRLMIKIGAEGVFCGALRDQGLGFALKIDDGNMSAAEVTVASMLWSISKPNEKELAALEKYATQKITNWRKLEVGEISATRMARLKLS